MPVNLRNHWILLKITKTTKDIIVYDSINLKNSLLMNKIKSILALMFDKDFKNCAVI